MPSIWRQLVVAAAIFAGGTGSLGQDISVPISLGRLPWRAETVVSTLIDRDSDYASVAWRDLDGDGFEDVVFCQNLSVYCYVAGGLTPRLLWQHPIPPPFDTHRPPAAVSLDFDLEGDGTPDVVVVARTADGWRTHVWILDASPQTSAIYYLKSSEDARNARRKLL